MVSARVVQKSFLTGKDSRAPAGGVWAAWCRLCEAVLLSAACRRCLVVLAMRSFEMSRLAAKAGLASAANRERLNGLSVRALDSHVF